MEQLLNALGLNTANLLAGFFGGVVSVFVFRRTKPFDAVGTIIVGTLAANYLAGIFTHYIGPELSTPFVVGLTGMSVCAALAKAIDSFRPMWTKGEEK